MAPNPLKPATLIALLIALAVGCGEPAPTATDAPPAAPPAEAPAAQPEAQSPGPPDAETPPASRAGAPEAPQAPELAERDRYRPPFPERVELFVPPARTNTALMESGEGSSSSVELQGFVTTDRSYAILAIDGVVVPMPEGVEKYGVEVISIAPPNAVLQRGRDRWTASLQ